MKKYNKLLLGVTLLCSNVVLANTLVNVGYENGELTDICSEDTTIIKTVEDNTGSMTTSSNYQRNGVNSIRTQLIYGDVGIQCDLATVNVRAEQSIRYTDMTEVTPVVQRGVTNFYGMSVLLDPNDFAYDTNGDILFQIKQGSSTPSFHLMVDEGKFKYHYKSASGPKVSGYFETVGVEKGVWYDIVVEMLPEFTNDGVLRLSYKKATDANYTQVFEKIGPNLISDKDGYIKWGIYKSTWSKNRTDSTSRTIYHDDIKVASTFAEVAQGALGGGPIGSVPTFTSDPITKANATEDTAYNASIATDAL